MNNYDKGEREAIVTRFYRCFADQLRSQAEEGPQHLAPIDDIYQNLRRSVHFAAKAGDDKMVFGIMLNFSEVDYFWLRNLGKEAIPLLDLTIDLAKRRRKRKWEAVFVEHRGTSYNQLGFIKEAIQDYETAIPIFRRIKNYHDLASSLQNLGCVLLTQGREVDRAERVLHEALTCAQRSDNAQALIGCLSTLGSLHRRNGRFYEASELYQSALSASILMKNRLSEGNSLSNLGLTLGDLGDLKQAERLVRRALLIAVELGDLRGKCNRMGHLGAFIMTRAIDLPPGAKRFNLLNDAAEHLAESVRLAHEIHDLYNTAAWTMTLGDCRRLSGRHTDAVKCYEDALKIAREQGYAELETRISRSLQATD